MKRILFCTSVPLVKELGAAKVIVELAEEMRNRGWSCDLISPSDFPIPSDATRNIVEAEFHNHLRKHLLAHADQYDVIDYDHEHLPFPRAEFSAQPLFVARSVLLVHHLGTIAIPAKGDIRGTFGLLLRGPARRRVVKERIARATRVVQEADIVNVSNSNDREELVRIGIEPKKIIVVPYGISESRRPSFDRVSNAVPTVPRVAFVGTFDYRKGAKEFPRIVRSIAKAVPEVQFRLLGTRGMFRTKEDVLAHFSNVDVDRLDIVPYFRADDLPDLLANCTIGMFPSYMEGMPFGVLEMMAASIPVVAYDSPGAPMILDPGYLVPRGNAEAMATRIVDLLNDSERLLERRIAAQELSRQFTWKQSAQMTDDIYCRELAIQR
jgi:glycosyltransferase involved in cell wall biosynthesis